LKIANDSFIDILKSDMKTIETPYLKLTE